MALAIVLPACSSSCWPSGRGSTSRAGAHDAADELAKAPIVSEWRSTDQAVLYENRATNPAPVAPPGSSMHECGLAVALPADFVSRPLAIASKPGLWQPYPADNSIHFEAARYRPTPNRLRFAIVTV